MRWRILLVVALVVVPVAACSDDAPALPCFDCRENAPGTGDLRADIVTQWTWVQSGSRQYFTFRGDGTAVRTWTSDEHDDVTYTTHDYSVDDNLVAIRDYGAYEFIRAGDRWTVQDDRADSSWIRCRPIDSS